MFIRPACLVLLLFSTACLLVDPLEEDYGLQASGGAGGEGLAGGGGVDDAITVTFGERDVAEIKGVTADTHLSGYFGGDSLNWGASESSWVDASPSEIRVALLRFDLGSIPSDALVEEARLSIFTHTSDLAFSDDPTRVFEVLEPWDEGEQDGQPGAANWYERMSGVPWLTAGCGVGSRAEEELASFTATMTGNEYVFALPLSVVQRWVSVPAANHGIAMLTYSPNGTGIATSESTLLNHRPMLTITYAP